MTRAGDIGRKIRSLFNDKPYNFGWVMEGLAASGRPVTRQQLEWLAENGIDAIISLTEDKIPPIYLEGLNIEYIHIPLRDHDAPPLDKLFEIVEMIETLRSRGRRVLIHCAAGLGRTGAAIASYLVLKRDYTADEAIRKVREIRPGSIEEVQEEQIRILEVEKGRRPAQG